MHARLLPAAPMLALALALSACGGGDAGNQAASQSGSGAGSQAAPQGGGGDALAAARDLLRATNFEQQLPAATEQMTNVMLSQLIAQARARGEQLTPRMEAELRRVIVEENRTTMTQARQTMLEDAASVYARYFTADELRELQRIQTAPVMQKAQRVAPQFGAELAQVGMRATAQREPEVRRRVTEAMARVRAEEGR